LFPTTRIKRSTGSNKNCNVWVPVDLRYRASSSVDPIFNSFSKRVLYPGLMGGCLAFNETYHAAVEGRLEEKPQSAIEL